VWGAEVEERREDGTMLHVMEHKGLHEPALERLVHVVALADDDAHELMVAYRQPLPLLLLLPVICQHPALSQATTAQEAQAHTLAHTH
jgi:hypothetical protein